VVVLLGLRKPGPLVGHLTNVARDWQYSHPEYHPQALERREPHSLPPDALIEHLKNKLAEM
jgi:hypothetical protein